MQSHGVFDLGQGQAGHPSCTGPSPSSGSEEQGTVQESATPWTWGATQHLQQGCTENTDPFIELRGGWLRPTRET